MARQSDKYNVDYDPVYTTGHYFSESIANLGAAQGVVRPGLSLFGLHEDCTREELLLKILAPYMRSKGIIARKVPLCNDWKTSIIGGEGNCFKFGCMPHMGVKAKDTGAGSSAADGAKTPCGVQTVLGMDVVWLIISQAAPPARALRAGSLSLLSRSRSRSLR